MDSRFPKVQTSFNSGVPSDEEGLVSSPFFGNPTLFVSATSPLSFGASSLSSQADLFQFGGVAPSPQSSSSAAQYSSLTEIDSSAEPDILNDPTISFRTVPQLNIWGTIEADNVISSDTASHNSIYSASTVPLESEFNSEPEEKVEPAKKRGRKRKSVSPVESESSATSDSAKPKHESKRESNNLSAKQYRERKKLEISNLKETVKDLNKKVEKLENTVKKLKTELATEKNKSASYLDYQSGSVNQESSLRFLGVSTTSSTSAPPPSQQTTLHCGNKR